MKTCLTLLSFLLPVSLYGQTSRPWEQLLSDVMTVEDVESSAWEDTYNLLCDLEEQPMNLNAATREELEQLPFLSDRQVEDIMEYRDRYGSMKSMNELRMIASLDIVQIELMGYFTYVPEDVKEKSSFPPLAHIAKYGRHELMGNVRVPLYKRKGDDNGYLGYPYRHWLRYQFNYNDFVKAGLVGSQDAGEPFFANRNSAGYDFYSYYVQVKHMGRLENLVVGKYKLSAGMGLVLNNSFGMGKLSMLQQLGRNTSTVRPHSSRSQSGYFQGAAATVRLSAPLQLTAFVSYRPIDATLNADNTMRSIVTDGYHRTETEMAKKNNSHATDAGAHIAYRHQGLHAGATAVYTHFDRELKPLTSTPYRRYYAQGQDFLNLSADYGYMHPRFALNGETALDRQGHIATLNNLSLQATDGLSLMLLQRFYSYRYTSLYARAVSEGGHVQNESAIYFGATWKVSPKLRLQVYTDYAYFAWLRYQVSQSSRAWDNLLSLTYSLGDWTLTGRHRLQFRPKDDATKTQLQDLTEHRARLALSWNGTNLSCTTQADGVSTGASGAHDKGFMVGESVACQWRSLKLSFNAGYFNTDSYDARLYVYERGPLYAFSYPSYYGEGVRCAMMIQATISRRLTLTAKGGYTHYLDRDVISSGLQQIDGSTMTDVDLQFRWKL